MVSCHADPIADKGADHGVRLRIGADEQVSAAFADGDAGAWR